MLVIEKVDNGSGLKLGRRHLHRETIVFIRAMFHLALQHDTHLLPSEGWSIEGERVEICDATDQESQPSGKGKVRRGKIGRV